MENDKNKLRPTQKLDGKLETMDINDTVGITTTELTVTGYYFMLGNVKCSLAKESEFDINSITKSES